MTAAPKIHAGPGSNAKLGKGVFVSTSSRTTCPNTCPFKNNGCYAENFPMNQHWNAVTNGQRGDSWEVFLAQVRKLAKSELWRHNQAGDLAGEGDSIDLNALNELVLANRGRRGFTYTHKPMWTMDEQLAVKKACREGFTINVSTDSMLDAENAFHEGFPVATVLPSTTKGLQTRTHGGVPVLVCPAVTKGWTCKQCGLCYDANRRYIIGFPSHGARKKAVDGVIASDSTTRTACAQG